MEKKQPANKTLPKEPPPKRSGAKFEDTVRVLLCRCTGQEGKKIRILIEHG
jgi:hypothetical protein